MHACKEHLYRENVPPDIDCPKPSKKLFYRACSGYPVVTIGAPAVAHIHPSDLLTNYRMMYERTIDELICDDEKWEAGPQTDRTCPCLRPLCPKRGTLSSSS